MIRYDIRSLQGIGTMTRSNGLMIELADLFVAFVNFCKISSHRLCAK
jgi:hypothetical protein